MSVTLDERHKPMFLFRFDPSVLGMTSKQSWMVLASAFLLLLTACGESGRPRCAQCGMFADTAPAWTVESGDARYDAPKCALRAEGPNPALRFRGYYEGELRPGADYRFVLGSDVRGPMGDDLVPVRPEQVDHFIADHGGRALAFNAIDTALLDEADGL